MQLKDRIFIKLILPIPIINIVIDIIMNLFISTKSIVGITRVVYMIIIILYYLNFYKLAKTPLNQFLFFFTIYLLGLTLISSDLSESFIDGFVKIFLSLIMIPIGIQLGQMIPSEKIVKSMIWVLIALLINYGFSQFFKLGVSIYDEDSFYIGGATASAPIIMSLGILLLLNSFNKNALPYPKILIVVVIALSLFVILLSVKRGAIFALLIGFIIYYIFTTKKITATFRIAFIGVFLSTIIIPNSELLKKRVESRTTEKNELKNENRYKETFYIFDEFSDSNILQILFGKEAFNSGVVMKKYFGRERQVHVDYNLLLLGTGVLGLLSYLYLHYLIYKTGRNVKNRIKFARSNNYTIQIKENFALLMSVLTLSLIMSFSGGIQFVSYRIMLFLIIGFTIGEMIKVRKTIIYENSNFKQ